MTIKRSCVAALIAVAISSAAAWGEAPANSGSGRFTMSPVEGGFLRLDTETGAVSMCAGSSPADWTCRPVDDTASQLPPSEISRLEQENKDLRDRLRSLEAPAEPPPGSRTQIPTEEEVDQALDYLERVYKKFRDRIKNLDKPAPPPHGEAPPPPPPSADPAPPKGSL